jgi:hypothetical protein
MVVRKLKGIAKLGDEGKGLLWLEFARMDEPCQVNPVDMLHDEIVVPVGRGAEVVKGDDVRMLAWAWASRRKRSAYSGFSSKSGGRILMATNRSSWRWYAL